VASEASPDDAPPEGVRKKKRKKKAQAAPEDGAGYRVPGLVGWTRPAHWPAFTAGWPRDEALEQLVEAFVRGDHRRVREEAPGLAARTEDDEVRRCALELRTRIEPDPMGKTLIVIAGLLLAFLAYWYLVHRHGPA
jgi:hypothetical protein